MKMRQKSQTRQTGADKVIKDIRWATRKQYLAEEKIRIVLDRLWGEETIAELCRREGITQQTLKRRSRHSSVITIIRDTTRASTTSRPQMFNSGAGNRF